MILCLLTKALCFRCSLLEDTDLLPLDVTNEEKEETKEEFPLPDIVLPDGEEWEQGPVATPETDVTPTIILQDDCDSDNKEHNDNTILSGVTSSQISEICDEYDDNLTETQPDPTSDLRHDLAKNYTVEDGFERPWDNVMASAASVAGTEDIDDSSDISDDETVEGKSSSSSSFPSESSGIFYKAEYTPPIMTPPISGHLSIENRDTYWRTFFTRNSTVGDHKDPHHLQKSRSGCNSSQVDAAGLLPAKPSSMCRSKSDAKIGYSCDTFPSLRDDGRQARSAVLSDKCDIASRDLSNELITFTDTRTSYPLDIEPREQEPGLNEQTLVDIKSLEGQADEAEVSHSRNLRSPLKEEVFDQPWTEVGGDSPKQAASSDSLGGTISQEMQDLLTSIQSLGSNEAEKGRARQAGPKMQQEWKLREKNVDFENLMKEVENQIRFSVTAELLERMANCPSIENYFLSDVPEDHQSVSTPHRPPLPPPGRAGHLRQCPEVEAEGGAGGDTFLGSPPIPDLLQATVKPGPGQDRLSQASFYSQPPPPQLASSPPALDSPPPPPKRGVTSPSPDHSRRRFTSLTRPSEIAGSGVSRYQVTGRVPDMRTRVQAGAGGQDYSMAVANLNRVTNDIENFCDIINSDKVRQDVSAGADTPRSSDKFNEKLEQDLADTQIVMKDIEHTVDSFRRHLSLPSGRVGRTLLLHLIFPKT